MISTNPKRLTLQQMIAAGFTDKQCHAALQERIEESINEWRAIYHDAFKAGDDVLLWEAGKNILVLEHKRDTMRQPKATG